MDSIKKEQEEMLKSLAIKIKTKIKGNEIPIYGSGILYMTKQSDYHYIITAGHCLLGKKDKDEQQDIEDIEYIEIDHEKKLNTSIESIKIKPNSISISDINNDIAVLLVESNKIQEVFRIEKFSQVTVSAIIPNDVTFISNGYPQDLDGKSDIKTWTHFCEVDDKTYELFCNQKLSSSTGELATNTIGGYSGSALFIEKTNTIVGIITELKDAKGNTNKIFCKSLGEINNLLEKLNPDLEKIEISKYNKFNRLLPQMKSFLNTIHLIEHNINFKPESEDHILASVNYNDISGFTTDNFCNELIDNMLNYFISQTNLQQKEKNNLTKDPRSLQNQLRRQHNKSFNKLEFNVQFLDLLTYNLLISLYKATPLLRILKLDRRNSNVVHVAKNDDGYTIYYIFSDIYNFGEDSFESVLTKGYNEIRSIAKNSTKDSIYSIDDFIEPEVRPIAEKIMSGDVANLENIKQKFIFLATFDDKKKFQSDTKYEVMCEINESISSKISSGIKIPSLQSIIKKSLHYIVFPVYELNKIKKFFEEGL